MAHSGGYNTVNISCSDHDRVWMELGKSTKTTRRGKRAVRIWHLERFEDDRGGEA